MATPGQFGEFGGRHVPEPLEEPLAELAAAYEEAIADDTFMAELRDLLEHFAGRPTPVFYAETLSSTTRSGRRCWQNGLGKTG
jgi:tryptophan synthase beta chain